MTCTELQLPWPPSALSPNKRQHWTQLSKAKAAYRLECANETALRVRPDAVDSEPKHIEFVFIPPDRRSYDVDNLLARMKAGIDGMADALGIDDKVFVKTTISVAASKGKPGAVMVEIREASC